MMFPDFYFTKRSTSEYYSFFNYYLSGNHIVFYYEILLLVGGYTVPLIFALILCSLNLFKLKRIYSPFKKMKFIRKIKKLKSTLFELTLTFYTLVVFFGHWTPFAFMLSMTLMGFDVGSDSNMVFVSDMVIKSSICFNPLVFIWNNKRCKSYLIKKMKTKKPRLISHSLIELPIMSRK